MRGNGMKFTPSTVDRWTVLATEYVAEKCTGEVSDVVTGSDAWEVAHRCGITREAYEDRTVVDAHIKTVLAKIFSNAIFKDNYHY
jgi:hypothetical protein